MSAMRLAFEQSPTWLQLSAAERKTMEPVLWALWQDAWRAAHAKPECPTCKGVGVVGGHVGQTPEQFDYVYEPCPDCAQQGAVAEDVVAWAVLATREGYNPHHGFCHCQEVAQLESQRWRGRGYSVAMRPLVYGDRYTSVRAGCGACGDACASRGSCRLTDESPKISQGVASTLAAPKDGQ